MTDVLYEPGEIVPQCGTTLDVYVSDDVSVTIGGKTPADWPEGWVIAELTTDQGVNGYRVSLGAGARIKAQLQVGHCRWQQDVDSGVWHTDCGVTFEFIDDGPAENRMRFCYYCGKRLAVEP